jgi:hypothetical protein
MPEQNATPLTAHSSIVTQTTDTGAVLMDTATGDCFELNHTGAEIWAFVGQGLEIPAIAQRIAAIYRLTNERACADVEQLIGQLIQRGIIRNASR